MIEHISTIVARVMAEAARKMEEAKAEEKEVDKGNDNA
jgi:hypothetical protein